MNLKVKDPIKRVDVEILSKMLTVSYEQGKLHKSKLARKCNMGYDKCVKYLDFLDLIGFITSQIDEDDRELILLTESGIKFCKTKLANDSEKKSSEFSLLLI